MCSVVVLDGAPTEWRWRLSGVLIIVHATGGSGGSEQMAMLMEPAVVTL